MNKFKEELKNLILDELTKKHKYFITKGNNVFEVVKEQDFEEVAGNIISKIPEPDNEELRIENEMLKLTIEKMKPENQTYTFSSGGELPDEPVITEAGIVEVLSNNVVITLEVDKKGNIQSGKGQVILDSSFKQIASQILRDKGWKVVFESVI